MILSNLTITHDPAGSPTVLLSAGDYLADWPRISASQIVQDAPLLRAAAIKTFARGNVSHRIEFTRLVPDPASTYADAAELFAAVFNHSINIPVATGTIRFAIADGDSYDLADASVSSWPSTLYRGATPALDYQIVGGALTLVV